MGMGLEGSLLEPRNTIPTVFCDMGFNLRWIRSPRSVPGMKFQANL